MASCPGVIEALENAASRLLACENVIAPAVAMAHVTSTKNGPVDPEVHFFKNSE